MDRAKIKQQLSQNEMRKKIVIQYFFFIFLAPLIAKKLLKILLKTTFETFCILTQKVFPTTTDFVTVVNPGGQKKITA